MSAGPDDLQQDQDPPFRVHERAAQGTIVLSLEGDLDIVSAGEAGEVLSRVQAGSATVLLDLRGLRFMDSSGLRVVLEAQRRASASGRGGRLQVAPGNGEVRRVFDLSGVGGLVEIVEAPPEDVDP